MMAGYLVFCQTFMLTLNLTESLPGRVFVIEKGPVPEVGELMAFWWEGDWPYPSGSIFVKKLIGLPGAQVTTHGREFLVDGRPVGLAKERSTSGRPLNLGPVGPIPRDHYYVAGSHPDSLDSRYQLTGWVRRDQVIGRAHRIF